MEMMVAPTGSLCDENILSQMGFAVKENEIFRDFKKNGQQHIEPMLLCIPTTQV